MMGPPRCPTQKRKPPRWRAIVCNCGLHENSHTITSKKAWRKHQIDLGKLLAGARDAEPKDTGKASGDDQQSMDFELDINSSIVSDPYAGTDYQSLHNDDLSRVTAYSTGDPGPSSSSISLSQPTATNGSKISDLHPKLNATKAIRFPAVESLNQPSVPNFSELNFSEANMRMSSGLSADSTWIRTQSLASTQSDNNYEAEEISFLEEVEKHIGDPDEWTSCDESVAGDPFEVGLMKGGLIDEDILEDEGNLEVLDLEDSVADLYIGTGPGASTGELGMASGKSEPTFPYENETGRSCRTL